MFNPAQIAGPVIALAASVSSSTVVGTLIKASRPVNGNLYNKVLYAVGGAVLSGVAADHAERWMLKQYEDTVQTIKKIKNKDHTEI